jgi:hypothetical protein
MKASDMQLTHLGVEYHRSNAMDNAIRQFIKNHGVKPQGWKDEDQAIISELYEFYCKQAKITPF